MSTKEVCLKSEDEEDKLNWFGGNFKWVPASAAALKIAEEKILSSYLETPYSGRHVNIGHHVGNEENLIWTVFLNEKSKNTPVVLVHGFACGVPIWVLNMDYLAKDRPVYAIDVLGFGRSSRPAFSKDSKEAEDQLVDAIEEWRRRVNINNFILVGHSMGGFLSASYALRYPDRVRHLVLVDPWGFLESQSVQKRMKFGTLIKVFAPMVRPVDPFDFLRVAGPLGPLIIDRMKPVIKQKFAPLTEEAQNAFISYIYNNNASPSSGEGAFKAMTEYYGWAKFPMCHRLGQLHQDVQTTFVCGSKSWLSHQPAADFQRMKPTQFEYYAIMDGSHEVFADHAPEFHSLMEKIFNSVDRISVTNGTEMSRNQRMSGHEISNQEIVNLNIQ